MSDQELQQLAREYAKEKGYSTFSEEVIVTPALDFLRWLTKTHCIVSREEVTELYDCYKQHEVVTDKKGLHEAMLIARGSMAAFRDIFGLELFKERSGK